MRKWVKSRWVVDMELPVVIEESSFGDEVPNHPLQTNEGIFVNMEVLGVVWCISLAPDSKDILIVEMNLVLRHNSSP